MHLVYHMDNPLTVSSSRRKALRMLGTGVLLAVPFATLVRPAYAERGPVARSGLPAAAAPAAVPAAPAAPAAPVPSQPPVKGPSRLATTADTPLWADSGATLPLGVAPAGAIFEPASATIAQVIRVRDAYSGAASFLNRNSLTPVDAPAALAAPGRWWGKVTVDGAKLRSAPHAQAPVVGQLPAGSPLVVSAWVVGDQIALDNPAWAQLNDHTFIYSAGFRPVDVPSAPPLPVDAPASGRWIDINLTQQVLVAYDGRSLVRMVRTSTGRPGFETPPGMYAIQRRVASETMTSAGIAGASYYVPHVRWTQYFSADGMALHENYWKAADTFGIPSSHGCAGLVSADAQFFWDWATVGTPIVIHA